MTGRGDCDEQLRIARAHADTIAHALAATWSSTDDLWSLRNDDDQLRYHLARLAEILFVRLDAILEHVEALP